MKRSALIAAGAVLLGLVTATNAVAESAPGCGPVPQIGSTAYIGDHGQRWASVKQFKGCGKNWAYVYTWSSVHNGGAPYTPELVLIEQWNSKDAREPYGRVGLREGRYRQQELWSAGTNTLNDCTSAYVEWNSGATTYRVRTDIRC
ncbi:hypothetical protein [Lentzea flaviverrucosa]|uniref:Peptidase inhibitor family I36 n=1 Tax=Lentzea flaviverrucosa TaxID=200379 RepID=A0A1H9XJP8_9PSEU|nr:hypothetical protein [Lentzea flaviverrucosa]RDI20271.1 hypothetical protein DFR72_115113 [Lentzea flaviverrucosa]SES46301.1 hypothetical protein SAMN05216195_115113 [Lentzea flaviverrucosa]